MLVIPYFIQHRGCPHRCTFCNQVAIAGQEGTSPRSPADDVQFTIENWLTRRGERDRVQVAFFGGSFSCLDETVQRDFLEAVHPYISSGEVDSIRLSTRPDCLSEELCSFLFSHGVRTIELGIQSMSESVLAEVHRGHGVEITRQAILMLQGHGFETGVQLMVGLPGETTQSFLRGVSELAGYRPRFARLYPALVIRNTELAELYFSGAYRPLSLPRAVALCGRACELFRAAGTQVIRIGLQPSTDLEKDVLAGPYHPAFGELVRGRHWYLIARDLITKAGSDETVTIAVARKEYSSFVGQKRMNINRLNRRSDGASLVVKVDKSLDREQYSHVVS